MNTNMEAPCSFPTPPPSYFLCKVRNTHWASEEDFKWRCKSYIFCFQYYTYLSTADARKRLVAARSKRVTSLGFGNGEGDWEELDIHCEGILASLLFVQSLAKVLSALADWRYSVIRLQRCVWKSTAESSSSHRNASGFSSSWNNELVSQ